MERRKVSREEIEDALNELTGWALQNGRLHKEFQFESFAAAMGWMVSSAIHADKLDHHPNWSNVYNKVTVDLWTHDMDALSTLDLILAKQMNSLAS